MKPVKSKLSYHEILVKVTAYCAYQERSLADIERKLKEFVLTEQEKQHIIKFLAEENYWNEERFAITFAKSKLHQNFWGKVKIKYELSQKICDTDLISRALDTIEDNDYRAILEKILLRKQSSLKHLNTWELRQKLISYALQKGFEQDEIERKLDELGV